MAAFVSVKPLYIFLILVRLLGLNLDPKTIELRKTFPTSKNWNKKVILYCTKDRNSFEQIPKMYRYLVEPLLGKVVGEFICDQVHEIPYDGDGYTVEKYLNSMALTYLEVFNYGNGKTLYGWNISNPRIYNRPKEIFEFEKPLACNYEVNSFFCTKCSDYDRECEFCRRDDYSRNPLRHPPQSWCYVEEF